MLRYIAVLAVMMACFTGDVSAVTDQEFQDHQRLVEKMASQISHQASEMKLQALEIERQASEMKRMESEIGRQATIINQLMSVVNTDEGQYDFHEKYQKDLAQNTTTIEERVALLELQMTDLQDEVAGIDEDVSFLFDEQVIQDERLFSLEEENDQTDEELDQVAEDIESLQVTDLELDFRVTELEENGGSDGNSSISELEVRVETLEGTAADHETRITSTEANVEDLEGSSADHETRLTAAEENIQGLQMTDINHEARILALEENAGGDSQNETIAFYAVLTDYDTISVGSVVEFHEIVINDGNGYDNTTGVFTVPVGGDGTYYFSTHLAIAGGEIGWFDLVLNDQLICTAIGEHNNVGADVSTATCSSVVSVVEGDELKLVLKGSDDNTPLYVHSIYNFHGFNGFRI